MKFSLWTGSSSSSLFLSHASIEIYAILIFLAVLIAWILSVGVTALQYANFAAKRKGNDIIITRGLIERHQMTIPLARIQAVKIKENMIREPFGFATVMLVSAGGSITEKKKPLPSYFRSFGKKNK
ncbi:hypothetical protein BsIDN1_09130 [Bacillus safensis]|uniref:YdbS-like PH domain-containing protein n=1 Tax=Bacillus safensis TaxID=561879 RepID=A0A5S9M3E9_BACIA|nr:hypothetical protein BsIDN1_09130 [Bacillus safensis]